MQDQLRFTAQRRDGHIAAVCTGYDHDGTYVDFEVDAERFHSNSERQVRWSAQVLAAEAVMRAMIDSGMTPDAAWRFVEHTLPLDMRLGTEWRSDSVSDTVADGNDQPVQRPRHLGGQSSDGDS